MSRTVKQDNVVSSLEMGWIVLNVKWESLFLT